MAISGLDIQAVRQLSSQLGQKAQDIDSILQTLTAALNNTQWEGPDATQFRNDWSGQQSSSLRQVAQALRDAAQKATQNANAQEQTSNS